MSESFPSTNDSGGRQGNTNACKLSNQPESGPSSPQPVSWEETLRRWATTCSICGQPCTSEDAKQLALGHVMHWACYDEWLESLEAGSKRKAPRNIAAENELRRRFRKWKAGEL